MRHSLVALLLLSLLSLTAGTMVVDAATDLSATDPLTVSDLADDEVQVWQGRVVKVVGDDLIVKVEGENETFDVDSDADIRKNRKKCELDALAPRDFVSVATVGRGKGESVTKIRAFSAR